MDLLRKAWVAAKIERRFSVGPVSILYRLTRSTCPSLLRKNFKRLFTSNGGYIRVRSPTVEPELTLQPMSEVKTPGPNTGQSALLVGVGPGFGFSLAHKLAAAGMNIGLVCRDVDHIRLLIEDLKRSYRSMIRGYHCDATDEISVGRTMARFMEDFGAPNLVVYAVQGYAREQTTDLSVAAFQDAWRQNCLGAFIVAREAARVLVPLQRGTIVFVGSTSSVIGRAAHLSLAIGKFGQRALAQVLSRELSGTGVHVTHLIIDADIIEPGNCDPSEPQSDPNDLADLVLLLHNQPKSAWTSEIDARPWNQKFWEHC